MKNLALVIVCAALVAAAHKPMPKGLTAAPKPVEYKKITELSAVTEDNLGDYGGYVYANTPVYGSVEVAELDNYYFLSTSPIVSFNLTSTWFQYGFSAFLLVAKGRFPTVQSYDWASTSFTNSSQILTINTTTSNSTFSRSNYYYVSVYGYNVGYSYYTTIPYYLTAYNGVPMPILTNDDTDTESLAAAAYFTYSFTVPVNTWDFSLIVTSTRGDPDQYVYNSNNTLVYANTSSTWGSSCIVAVKPAPGQYTYKVRAYGSYSFNFTTGFFINHDQSCSFGNYYNSEIRTVRATKADNKNLAQFKKEKALN